MNQKEWKEFCKINRKEAYFWYNKTKAKLLSKEFESLENCDVNAKVIHHLRDTEEQRKYNDEHYELFGFEIDEDGNESFVYGNYVVFWTKEHHNKYHHASDETRKKISESLKKNPPMKGKHHTKETKELLSNKCSGWHHSKETKLTISNCSKEKWEDHEYRLKVLALRDDKFCKKISDANKAKWQDDEYRQHQIDVHTGKKVSDETKLKMSLSRKGENNCNYGKAKSESTKEKLRESCRKQGLEVANAYKLYKSLCGDIKWNEFQKLYSKHKEAFANPSGILSLSMYNSDYKPADMALGESVYDYNDEPDFNSIKQISLDKLDDVYALKAKQTGSQ